MHGRAVTRCSNQVSLTSKERISNVLRLHHGLASRRLACRIWEYVGSRCTKVHLPPFFVPLAPLSTRSSWADDGCQFQLPVWLARAAPSNCWRNRRASRKQVSTKEWHDEPSICEQCVQTLHILIIISSSCTASCTGVHTCFLVAPNQLAWNYFATAYTWYRRITDLPRLT